MGEITDLGYKLSFSGDQTDENLDIASDYPKASEGAAGQVPVNQGDGTIAWEQDSSDANLAPVEATSTASQAYAVNSFLIYDGQLYRVTAAITQGDALTVGTNIAVADVGTYLAMVAAAPNAVGFAPAGYGLGTTSGKPVTDWNDAVDNGWHYPEDGISSYPPKIPNGAYSQALVISRGNRKVQMLFNTLSGAPMYSAIRAYHQGTWGDWEYVNPPLIAGTEYRTTGRYNGKPVYAKALPSKTLIATGTTTFDGSNGAIANLTHIIRVEGYVGKAPLAQYAGITGVSVNASNQLVISTSGAVADTAYPVVYYLTT